MKLGITHGRSNALKAFQKPDALYGKEGSFPEAASKREERLPLRQKEYMEPQNSKFSCLDIVYITATSLQISIVSH